MKKLYLIVIVVTTQLTFFETVFAQKHDKMAVSKSITDGITNTISGIIVWDTLQCHDITPWRNMSYKTRMARIFNFQINVSTVKKDNTPGSLSPKGSFPDKPIKAKTIFEAGEINNVHFTISNIPSSITQVYVDIKPKPGLYPAAMYDNVSFSPLVIDIDNSEKTITMTCNNKIK